MIPLPLLPLLLPLACSSSGGELDPEPDGAAADDAAAASAAVVATVLVPMQRFHFIVREGS